MSQPVEPAADASERRAFYDVVWAEALAGFDIGRARDSFADLGIPESALRERRVLDGGCGMGANALIMAQAFGAQVTAIDISPTSIDITREVSRRHGVKIEAQVDDLTTLATLADGAFDTVVSVSVVQLTGQTNACLGSFLRVLRPGGECFLSVPRHSPLTQISGFLQWLLARSPGFVGTTIFAMATAAAWVVSLFSRAARARFNSLKIGVREALHCTGQRVERDQVWCRLMAEAGFVDVRLVKTCNIWGHQGMYHGRKP